MKEKFLAVAPFLIAALLNIGLTLILSGLFSGFDGISLNGMMLPAFIATTVSFLATVFVFRRRDGEVTRRTMIFIAVGTIIGIVVLVIVIGMVFLSQIQSI
jgi:hypothetical protein